jgi:pyruvate,orthophosphate dikinase
MTSQESSGAPSLTAPKFVYRFGGGQADGSAEMRNLLGGKGAGLAEMTNLGIPVPPGFTITTEVCTAFMRDHKVPDAVRADAESSLDRVAKIVGTRFGDPAAPLLVSVRSGARASMPGMMDTILNLGLTDAAVAGLAKKTNNPRFALDAYRRFITMYSDIVLGIKREAFEEGLDEARREVAKGRGLDPRLVQGEELKRAVPDSEIDEERLKKLVDRYKKLVEEKTGKPFPQDPHAQLWGAIEAVFKSWSNPRAVTYRKIHDIPASWGTACNVQAMVFGNMGDTSATGVAFTRDPSTGEKKLMGEWLPNAQGEDVVAGIRTPRKIAQLREELPAAYAQFERIAKRLERHYRDAEETLEAAMPDTYHEFLTIAHKLEDHSNDMQDIEFTIQEGKLYMLQCRSGKRSGKAAVRIAIEMVKAGKLSKDEALLRVEPESLNQLLHPVLDPEVVRRSTPIAKGLNASPGAAVGAIVFTADEAERRAGRGEAVILVRTETSPEDIHGMKAAKGILTARGGMTSHAAVVARGMGTPCVAGTSALSVDEHKKTVRVAVTGESGRVVEELILREGEIISLDGGTGAVYRGSLPLKPAELSGDYQELMGWADERRRLKVRSIGDTPKDARTARNYGAEGIGLCRTEHMFFGDDRINAMREMILAATLPDREVSLAKLLPFQREDFEGIFREMKGLPVTIRLLDPPLHEFLPHSNEQIEHVSQVSGLSAAAIRRRAEELAESNPMLGHRGCRLAITYPEIYAMQTRAILEAALNVVGEGLEVRPEIMIPLTLSKRELEICKEIVDAEAAKVFAERGKSIKFLFGTMIELPRAALRAGELAELAEFFSFGTNDLTQTTLGLSRDDADKTFLPVYVSQGIFTKSPFATLDQEGVGEMVSIAQERGRKTRPDIKLGICGEHGGDPVSVEYFHRIGLDYVSCSPFRVPIARLAAAQATIRGEGGSREGSGTS